MSGKIAVRNIRLCSKDCLCLYVCPTGASDTENSIIDLEFSIRVNVSSDRLMFAETCSNGHCFP